MMSKPYQTFKSTLSRLYKKCLDSKRIEIKFNNLIDIIMIIALTLILILILIFLTLGFVKNLFLKIKF